MTHPRLKSFAAKLSAITIKPQALLRIEWRRVPWPDVTAIVILAGLSVMLFRSHIFADGLYIGNADRLNSNLKILKFYVDGLSQGHLDAWSDFEMMGYDTFTLPYTFPSGYTLIAYLLGVPKLYTAAGLELTVLLAIAGISAYAFLRMEIRDAFPAAIGAILYEFSALTILKISQNDLSFAVFIFIPILMAVIRTTNGKNVQRTFFLVSGLVFLLLHFTFLQ